MSVRVEHGDCLEVMPCLAAEGVLFDSVVTDPPYHLASITKRFGGASAAPAQYGTDGAFARASRGFMGKQWDGGDVAFRPETWRLAFDLLKPGAYLLAFSSTRTYHRMACAVEDAGFEIRDQIGWLYASGFPKSHNIGGGWGTALKPAWEPIVVARKPLAGTVATNVQAHGTGALNIDGCRVPSEGGRHRENEPSRGRRYVDRGATNLAALPGPRGGDPSGRWPANVIHDGSDEVLHAFPDAPGQQRPLTGAEDRKANVYGKFAGVSAHVPRADAGSAARFFYSAKADAADRLGSRHPTVKPVDLIAYLCRLVTPPGGTVLDPFAGSGTTGMACLREGFRAVLIEREAEYIADIHRRLAHVRGADAPLFAGAMG